MSFTSHSTHPGSVIPCAAGRAFLIALVVGFSAAASIGCGDDASAVVRVEFARSGPASATCAAPTSDPAPSFRCAVIDVCQRDSRTGECFPVQATTGNQFDVGTGGPLGHAVATPVEGATGSFSAQLKLHDEMVSDPNLAGRLLDVRVIFYDNDGVARAQAFRTGVPANEFVEQGLRMRAEQYGESNCAGPRVEEGSPNALDRAFHAGTRLPNGDVLLYGGVREDAPVELDATTGMRTQQGVEVYRVQEGRLAQVEGTFSRVFFGSVLLTTDPDEHPYEILVTGGVSAVGPVVAFDYLQGALENYHGTPVIIREDAEPQPDQLIRYFWRENRIEVVDVPTERPSGATVGDDFVGEQPSPSVSGPVAYPPSVAWSFEEDVRFIDRTGASAGSSVGNTDRFGHSVTRLGDGSAFVWGGNINTFTTSEHIGRAGQLATPTTTLDIASEPAPRPPSVAFHTASRIGSMEVLLIGGFETTCHRSTPEMDPLCTADTNVSRRFSTQPIVRLALDSTGIVGVTPLFVDTPYRPSFLHAVASRDPGTVVLTGGAGCNVDGISGECMEGTSFQPLDQVFLVDTTRGAYNDDDDGLPDTLLQGRFAHQVTELSACPIGVTDCRDRRFLVSGGLEKNGQFVSALRHQEVLMADPTSPFGDLVFAGDSGCEIAGADSGLDAGVDSGSPDTGPRDSGLPDSSADVSMDALDGAAGGG